MQGSQGYAADADRSCYWRMSEEENCRLWIVRFEPWTRDEGLARWWMGSLDEECVKARAEAFALHVIRLAESLPMTGAAGLCGDGLLQSAGLIRANCQAAFRAASDDDSLPKLKLVAEEARECGAWLELLGETDIVEQSKLDELTQEAGVLVASVERFTRSTRRN